MFGYGALVSDTQVSWPDGQSRDVLQKIHPVGRMLMAGFSGSVRIGFHLLADMQRYYALPDGRMAMPMAAAWYWRRRGRRIFAGYPAADRALGAQLLLVGVSAHKDGPFHISRCARMRSPDFYPEFARGIRWLSIGCGAQTGQAREYAADAYSKRFMETDFQSEANNPGGVAFSTAVMVAMDLTRNPVAGVSKALQIGTVFNREHRIECLIQEFARGAWTGWKKGDCPALCRTYADYKAFTDREGLTAAAGAA